MLAKVDGKICGTYFGLERAVKKPKKIKAMKKLIYSILFALLTLVVVEAQAKDYPDEYLGLPGDNLNLFAVMDIFQASETLEGFERSLNDPKAIVNNLDLNNDNYVDYIMVLDFAEDDVHNIVLRVALNEKAYQDVAVFTVQKLRNGAVEIQLIGDKDLYGPNYIVEPNYEETPNPGYTGARENYNNSASDNVTYVTTNYYEVSRWPVIVYLTAPSYRGWRSAWSWGYYPSYWQPWTPYYYHYYYGYHYNDYYHYRAHYRHWNHHRCNYYDQVYYTRYRRYDPVVVVNINNGRYRNTYSHPETRKEGEKLYARRVSDGTTLPGTPRAKRSQDTRPADNSATRAVRKDDSSRDLNRSKASERAVRPQEGRPVSGAQEKAVREARPQQSVERPVQRSSGNKEVRQERPATQPRSVSTSGQNKVVKEAKPQQSVERPVQRSSGTKEVRQERPATQPRNTQAAPRIETEKRSAPAVSKPKAAPTKSNDAVKTKSNEQKRSVASQPAAKTQQKIETAAPRRESESNTSKKR